MKKRVISIIVAVCMLTFGGVFLSACKKKNKGPSYDYSINLSITEDGILKFKQPKTYVADSDSGTYFKYKGLNNTGENYLTVNDIPSEMDGDYYIVSFDVKTLGNYEVGEPYTVEVERHNVYLGYLNLINRYETYVRNDYGVELETDLQFTINDEGKFVTLSDYYANSVESITTLLPIEECLTIGDSTLSCNSFVVNLTNGKQLEFPFPLSFTNQINTGSDNKSGTATYTLGNKTFTYNYYVPVVSANVTSSNNNTKYYTINNINIGSRSSVSICNYYGTTAVSDTNHNVKYTAISESGLNSIKHVKQLACYINLTAGALKGFNNLETLILTTDGLKIYELFDGQIPASLKTVVVYLSDTIPDYFFYGCSGLKNVYMTSAVENVSDNSFNGLSNVENMIVSGKFELDSSYLTSLKNVRISNNTSSVVGGFVKNNKTIENIFMPDTVTSVGNYSFKGLTNLKSLRISNGLETIKIHAFEDIVYDKEMHFSNVSSVETFAFQCATVPKISFTDSLSSVGVGAFYGCENLETLVMPSKNANIDMSALLGETNVKELHISGKKQIHELYKQPNDDKATLENIFKLEKLVVYGDICNEFAKDLKISGKTIEIVLDDSVTSIGNNAFENTNVFASLNTNKVQKIGTNAFLNNTSLSNISTTSSLAYVGSNAFNGSSFVSGKDVVIVGDGVLVKYNSSSSTVDLRNLTDDVKYIMNGAFGENVTQLTLGESVKYIESNVFASTKKLSKLYIYSDSIEIINGDKYTDLFYYCSNLTIYVNLSRLSHYQNATYWKKYSSAFAPLPL